MLSSKTKKQQSLLAQYCRDGKQPEMDGVREDRLRHYRRLVFNIVYDAMEQAFPIYRSKLNKDQWKSIIENFVANFKFSQKELWRLPIHFLEFAKLNNLAVQCDMPWLDDLLMLEWVEIEVFNAKDRELTINKQNEIPLEKRILNLNPYHYFLQLEYPVFKAEFFEQEKYEKGQYFVICYRDFNNLKAHYRELSSFSLLVLKYLEQGQIQKLEELGTILRKELNVPKHVIDTDLPKFIQDMLQANILY